MKIDLKGYKGFKILKGDHSSEANSLSIYCLMNNITLLKVDKLFKPSGIGAYGSSGTEELHKAILVKEDIEKDYIPCGSVEWCLELLDKKVVPDYYPSWLEDSLYRNVWKSNEWILGRKLFVKPQDKYKRFTGFVTTGTYKKKKKPPFWYSDVVHFTNEWRYYISGGIIDVAAWYYGDEVNTPDPPLFPARDALKDIPKDFCGAIDFGMTKEGNFTLVEVQHPFACGWYGTQETVHLYLQWLVDGWIYMKVEDNVF